MHRKCKRHLLLVISNLFCLSLQHHQKTNAMDNEIKKVYSGSVVNAEYIGSVLADNDIQYLIRNFRQEGLVAGWAAGTLKGDASVYVFEKDYDRAMLLLDEINAAEMEGE